MKKILFLVAVFLIIICFGSRNRALKKPGSPTLKKIAVIDLPGKTGKRFDYLTIDYKHNYLFSAHLGADVLYVIDLKTNKLVKMITDTPGAEGVEYIEEPNKAYTSNWPDNTIGFIEMKKMKGIKKIPQ